MRAGFVARLALLDLRRRTRHFHFLVALGASVLAAWLFHADKFKVAFGVDRGHFTSTWTGAAVGAMIAGCMTILGFLYLRGQVAGDARSGVGKLVAASRLPTSDYVLTRFLSNLAVLAMLATPIVLVGPVVVWARGEGTFAAAPYLLQLLPLVVPTLIAVAAVAVLFDAVPALRGGAGNVVYVALWGTALWLVNARATWWADPAGFVEMARVARVAADAQHVSIGSSLNMGGIESPNVNLFDWPGFDFTARFLGERLMWVGIALLMLVAAAVAFDRFDPARARTGALDRALARVGGWLRRRPRAVADSPWEGATRLTPLGGGASGGSLRRLLGMTAAELRMMRRPVPVAIFAPLALFNLLAGVKGDAHGLLALFWLLPVLLWSRLGARDALAGTGAIVFSAPRAPLLQPLAAWLAGVACALVVSIGIGLSSIGDGGTLASWLLGAAFVSALAVACGSLAGSDRLFQGLYLLWWIVSVNGNHALDFMDLDRSHANVRWLAAGTVLLLAVALSRRARQYGELRPRAAA